MKHFPLLKNFSMVCLALAAMTGISSCTHTSSPAKVSNRLQVSSAATVYSYNDAASPANRLYKAAGPLPDRTCSALATWLHHSTPKRFSYTYPQYYLSFVTPEGQQEVWALCSDAHGNFVGVMVPPKGVPAWDIPFASEQIVYVCDGEYRKGLSEAIMDSLQEFDGYRIETRRASGLTHSSYLISASTDENAKREAKLREAREQANAARAKNAENAMADAAVGSDDDLDLDSYDSDDDDLGSSDDEEEEEDDSED